MTTYKIKAAIIRRPGQPQRVAEIEARRFLQAVTEAQAVVRKAGA